MKSTIESVPVFHGELGKYLEAGFALLPKLTFLFLSTTVQKTFAESVPLFPFEGKRRKYLGTGCTFASNNKISHTFPSNIERTVVMKNLSIYGHCP